MCIADRAQPKRPGTCLRAGEGLSQDIESIENFIHPRVKEAQQMIELITKDDRDKEMRDQLKNRKKDEEMRMLVSKLEDLNGRPLEIPEYRDVYKVNSVNNILQENL